MDCSFEKDTFYNEGTWAESMCDLKKAKLLYCRGIRIPPTNELREYSRLVEVLKKENNLAKAEEICRKAITLSPNTPETLFTLANLLKDQQRYEEAGQIYSQYIDKFTDCHFSWGEVLYYQGKYNEAIEQFQKFIEKRPTGASFGNLAWIMYNNQEYELALETFKLSIKHSPSANISYLLYGIIQLHHEGEIKDDNGYSKVLSRFHRRPNYIKKEIIEILTKEITLTESQIVGSMDKAQKIHFEKKLNIIQNLVLKLSKDLKVEVEETPSELFNVIQDVED